MPWPPRSGLTTVTSWICTSRNRLIPSAHVLRCSWKRSLTGNSTEPTSIWETIWTIRPHVPRTTPRALSKMNVHGRPPPIGAADGQPTLRTQSTKDQHVKTPASTRPAASTLTAAPDAPASAADANQTMVDPGEHSAFDTVVVLDFGSQYSQLITR